MTIQEQLPWDQVDDETLSYFKAIGVDFLTINPVPPGVIEGEDLSAYWADLKDRVEAHGLELKNLAATGWDEISLARPRPRSKDRCLVPASIGHGRSRDSHIGLQFQTNR